MMTPTIARLITVFLASLLTPTLSCFVQNLFSVHKLIRKQQIMAITKNFCPELEEYQQRLHVTINHYRISSPSDANQQEEINSSSSTIRPSNEGNQSSYFRSSKYSRRGQITQRRGN